MTHIDAFNLVRGVGFKSQSSEAIQVVASVGRDHDREIVYGVDTEGEMFIFDFNDSVIFAGIEVNVAEGTDPEGGQPVSEMNLGVEPEEDSEAAAWTAHNSDKATIRAALKAIGFSGDDVLEPGNIAPYILDVLEVAWANDPEKVEAIVHHVSQ